MATTAQQVTAGSPPPDPQDVGNAFVQQYYQILLESPELVFRFYQDSSKLGRPEDDGTMGSVSTLQDINKKILSLYLGGFDAEIKTVDAQDSHDGAVIVLVTGKLMGKDNIKHNFTQTFFLAQQLPPLGKGYFVLNDIFRYVEDTDNDGSQHLDVEVEAPATPDHASVEQENQNHVSEPIKGSSEEANGEEIYNPPVNEEILAAEEEQPVSVVADEVEDDLQLVTESNSKIEDAPKKSYASIVKILKDNGAPFTTATSTPPRSLPKQEQVTVAPQPVASQHEPSVIKSNAIENGNTQEGEADGYSIYIRGLPMSATATLLETEFKKFGAIKKNGIQVRSHKGFCFGFVEFEEMASVLSAIEASPVRIGEHQAYIEEKRSPNSRGNNNRGRFMNGRGGNFRNEGGRGRGNFGGGRGYNRTDFNNRSEFGNRSGGRGGYQNRGGDGYQRSDIAGSNGSRMTRGGSTQ